LHLVKQFLAIKKEQLEEVVKKDIGFGALVNTH
jgi:hypothetical protein